MQTHIICDIWHFWQHHIGLRSKSVARTAVDQGCTIPCVRQGKAMPGHGTDLHQCVRHVRAHPLPLFTSQVGFHSYRLIFLSTVIEQTSVVGHQHRPLHGDLLCFKIAICIFAATDHSFSNVGCSSRALSFSHRLDTDRRAFN